MPTDDEGSQYESRISSNPISFGGQGNPAPFRSPWDPTRRETPSGPVLDRYTDRDADRDSDSRLDPPGVYSVHRKTAPRTAYQEWLFRAMGRHKLTLSQVAERANVPFLELWKLANGSVTIYGEPQLQPTREIAGRLGLILKDRYGSLVAGGYMDKQDADENVLNESCAQNGGAPDYLRLLGVEVDPEALGGFPHVNLTAAAALGRMRDSEDGDETVYGRTSDVLPKGECVRTIQLVGDCMEPMYFDGDVLFIRQTQTAKDGDQVVARLSDGSLTCKIYREFILPWLEPNNGDGRIDAPGFQVVGVVEGYFRIVRRNG